MKQKIKRAVDILKFFLRIGWFTFGGGWSIVAQMEKEFVDRRKWITKEELFDYTAIGKSIPGTMIGNCSYLFGYHVGGVICAIAAVVGISLAPMVVLALIVPVYDLIRDNEVINTVMLSVRAAVIPIMVQVAAKLFRTALPEKKWWVTAVVAFILYLFFGVNPIGIVIFGAAAGMLLGGEKT